MSEEQNNSVKPSEAESFRDKWLNERVKPFKGQNFYEIRQKLLNAEELFEDPEFLCNDDILGDYDINEEDNKIKGRGKSKNNKSDGSDRKSYKWLRPSEIVKKQSSSKTPKFTIDGLTRFDVKQGALGDCWFLASISALADKKKFLNRVVCNDNTFDDENYAGIFHFRFWKFGEWVDVVIDDRLPVDDDYELVYTSSSEENEFWSPLLEKAYAKFRGSYKNIDGGLIELALQDFSGGILETYFINVTHENSDQFFKTKLKKNALIGAAVTQDRTDQTQLPAGHAYTITGAAKYKKTYLIRIRNPWGDETEWKGAWSDDSTEWNDVPDAFKEEIGFKTKDDGEFWISYKDFLKNFDEITICNLSPDENSEEVATKKWEKAQFKGEWVAGITAGGSITNEDTYHFNPQYLLTLDEPGDEDDDGLNSVVIALLQKEVFPKKDMIQIKFDVFKVEEDNLESRPMKKEFLDDIQPIRKSDYAVVQEIHGRYDMLPGKYLIIPSTDNPDVEGEFLLRVYVDNKFKLEEFDKKVEKGDADNDTTKSAVEILFDENSKNERIGWSELQTILNNFIGQENSSKHLSRSLIAMASKNYYRSINLEQFKKLLDDIGKWKAIYKTELKDGEKSLSAPKLRYILRSLGLNVNTKILNSLVYTYASNKLLTLDDFLMCIAKAKTLIEHFSDDEIKSMDRWTMRTLI